jgi:hypothetical protein
VVNLISLGAEDALWIKGDRVLHGKWVVAYKHWRNRKYLRPFRKAEPAAAGAGKP